MSPSRPLLSLCMIVRDSAKTLEACLRSIRPWVDEMIVVDTGSLDNTKPIARRLGADIFEFPWIDDFSAARNESLRQAKGQWLFWMDSDDTVDEANGRGLRMLAASQHQHSTLGYVIQVHCPAKDSDGFEQTTVVDHVKLFRNDPNIRFEGRIHEQVLPSIRRLGGEVGWTDLHVDHSGADQSSEGRQRKIERDLRILHLEITETPDHPFVLFNLGMTYDDIGDYAAAENWLNRCLAVSDPKESHVRKAYALLAASLTSMERFEEAKRSCDQGLTHYPDDKELLFRRATLAQHLGLLDDAVRDYRAVIRANGQRHFTSIDTGILSFKARHNLATTLALRGEAALAEVEFRSALDTAPQFRPAWRGLAQLLLEQRKLSTAELLAEEAESSSRSESLWLKAELAQREFQPQKSIQLLEQALQIDPDNLLIRQSYCQVLFETTGPASAVAGLEELARRNPHDGATYHNLGMAYASENRFADAVQSLEKSLQLRPNSRTTAEELNRIRAAFASSAAAAGAANGASSTNMNRRGAPLVTLPDCVARRPIPGDPKAFFCLHPRVQARGQRVSAGVCSICQQWRHPPAKLRPVPTEAPPPIRRRQRQCQYLGDVIRLDECSSCRGRVQVKVYACDHPAHRETTFRQCKTCREYKPDDGE